MLQELKKERRGEDGGVNGGVANGHFLSAFEALPVERLLRVAATHL